MSALSRCARCTRCLSRSLKSYKKSAAVQSRKVEGNLFEHHRNIFYSSKEVSKRFYRLSRPESTNEKDLVPEDRETQTLGTSEYCRLSEDSPASTYWKNIDFLLNRMSFVAANHLINRVLSNQTMTIEQFYEFMCHVEQSESFERDQLSLILRVLGFENKKLDKHAKHRWTEYLTKRFVSLGIPLDITYYNKVLRNYLQTHFQFSPLEFISTLEKQGVAPNDATFKGLVEAYCKVGDIKSASQILEHMREQQMPISPRLYKRLVLGNFIAGDKETAMKLFEEAGKMGFDSTYTVYHEVVLGHAIMGDLDGVIKFLEEAIDNAVMFSDSAYSMMLEEVARIGYQDIFDYLLNKMTEQSNVYYNTALDTLPRLFEQGSYDMAYQYYMRLNDPVGQMFYRCALLAKMSVEDVIMFHRKLKTDDVPMSSLMEYFVAAVQEYHYESAAAILPYFETEGEEFRTHLLWPLIHFYRETKDLEGLKKILPYMNVASSVYRLKYAFQSLELSDEKVRDVLTEHSKLNPGQVNGFMMLRCPSLKAAVEYAKTCNTIEDCAADGNSLINVLLKDISKNDWKDALELLQFIKRSTAKDTAMKRVLNFNLDLQEVKEFILEKNIIVEGVLQEKLSKLFSEKELEKVTRKKSFGSELEKVTRKKSFGSNGKVNEMVLQTNLKEFFSEQTGKVNEMVLQANLKEFFSEQESEFVTPTGSKSAVIRKFLSIINVQQLTALSQYFVARFYLWEGNAARGLMMMKDLKRQSPQFKPHATSMVKEVHRLCKTRKYKDAVDLLSIYQYDEHEMQHVPNFSPGTFFDIEEVKENIGVANRILKTLMVKGNVSNRGFRRPLINYWDFIASVGDLESIYEALDNLRNEYSFVPVNYTAVFTKIIKKGDQLDLKTAYERFTAFAFEQRVLLSLIAAFIECGQEENAKKTMASINGIGGAAHTFKSIFNRWATKGQPEYIEEFTKLFKGLPSDMALEDMIVINLRALCTKGDIDTVNKYFDDHVRENMETNIEACQMYSTFLKKHGRKVPLDIEHTLRDIRQQHKRKTDIHGFLAKILDEESNTPTTNIAAEKTAEDIAIEINDNMPVIEQSVDNTTSEDVPIHVTIAEKVETGFSGEKDAETLNDTSKTIKPELEMKD